MIELGDQLFDALARLLAALVGVEQLFLELADAPLLLLDAGTQCRAVAQQALVTLDQSLDRSLQALQVVRIASVRNGDDPPSMKAMLPTESSTRQVVDVRSSGELQT